MYAYTWRSSFSETRGMEKDLNIPFLAFQKYLDVTN